MSKTGQHDRMEDNSQPANFAQTQEVEIRPRLKPLDMLRRQQRSAQALLASLSGAIGVAASLVLINRQEVAEALLIRPGALLLVVTVALVFSVSIILFLYLRGWVPSAPPRHFKAVERSGPAVNGPSSNDIAALAIRLDALEQGPPAPVGVTAADVAQMVFPQVRTELAKVFEEKYEKKSALEQATTLNGERYNAAIKRLEREIEEQSRKGNVNLIIGVGTTLLAVALLAWIVLAQDGPNWMKSDPTWTQLAAHYIPRLSLVIFIEVFSFFFLRLYKATLNEARLYNDELTRLTIQWVATEVGMLAEEKGSMAALAKELLSVSKPPKLASTEGSQSKVDSDRMLKAVTTAIKKQVSEKPTKSRKSKVDKAQEDA